MSAREIIIQKIEDCMARIRDFETPGGVKNNKTEFEHKIKVHRQGRFFKILATGIVAILFFAAVVFCGAMLYIHRIQRLVLFPESAVVTMYVSITMEEFLLIVKMVSVVWTAKEIWFGMKPTKCSLLLWK